MLIRVETHAWTSSHYLDTHFRFFEFQYSFFFVGKGKSLRIFCGPPVSLEVEIYNPYLHGLTRKCESARVWAYRISGS